MKFGAGILDEGHFKKIVLSMIGLNLVRLVSLYLPAFENA